MASIAEELQEVRSTKREIASAIEEMGVDVPAKTTFREYANLIGDIVTTPTLKGLKKALQNGSAPEKYPVGTTLPDTYADYDSPWTVMDYAQATLADNTVNNGAYLVRLIAEPNSIFGQNANYGNSTVNTFLNSEYLTKCTSDFRDLVTEIKVPFFDGTIDTTTNAKCWLLSATEIMNQGRNHIEGFGFELWKQRTGLSSPDGLGANNAGRIMRNRDGVAQLWWTRSWYNSSNLVAVNTNGGTGSSTPPTSYGLVVACFLRSN